jgi:hypothetical protein
VCGVDSIERQIQSNALWWGGREVYVAEKYMAELSKTHGCGTCQSRPGLPVEGAFSIDFTTLIIMCCSCLAVILVSLLYCTDSARFAHDLETIRSIHLSDDVI